MSRSLTALLLAASAACLESPEEPSGPQPVELISIGASYISCGLDPARNPLCWGNSSSSLFPARVTQTELAFTTLSVGGFHACGMVGAVPYCWGANDNGQVGDGTTAYRPEPVPLLRPGLSPFVQISAGTGHTCAVDQAGQAWCWGRNDYGTLGDATRNSSLTPIAIPLPAGTTLASVTAGEYHSCGLTPAGKAWCWGLADFGQMGDGIIRPFMSTPVEVVSPGVVFASLTLGIAHTCGLTPQGTAWCWGRGHRGRLGNGTTEDKPLPTQVQQPQLSTWTEITAGGDHTCGLTAQGIAYCWGRNFLSALGTGDNTDRHIPTPVVMPAGVTFTHISGGFGHTCAVDTSRGAWCWGLGSGGRLGDGTEETRPVPVRVLRSP